MSSEFLEFRDRICKLVRLLSSDIDGERLAAVAGMDRTLKNAGMTFHDLADTVADRIVEVVKVKEVSVDRAAAESWINAANEMLSGTRLQGHERKFVADMRNKFTLRPTFEPSEKQAKWFLYLHSRVIGEETKG
jgi:hypothetical protein